MHEPILFQLFSHFSNFTFNQLITVDSICWVGVISYWGKLFIFGPNGSVKNYDKTRKKVVPVPATIFAVIYLISAFMFFSVYFSYHRIEVRVPATISLNEPVSNRSNLENEQGRQCFADVETESFQQCLDEKKTELRSRSQALNHYLAKKLNFIWYRN